jgi:hypothetical protein
MSRYPDDFRGLPSDNEREPTPQELADDAARDALTEADALAALFDRYAGDSGEDADAIYSIAQRIEAIRNEVIALLGVPRVMRGGGLAQMGRDA